MSAATTRRQFLQHSATTTALTAADAPTEQFVDCDEANEMLRKKYREPYGNQWRG